jgi:dephospho-CoA kinase
MASQVSPWIAPVLGLIEIGLLLAAVYLTIAQFRRNRASAYIERFNSKDMLESRVAIDDWYQRHSSRKEMLGELESNTTLATRLRQFCNLFQELGAAYQFGIAHRRTVRVLFDTIVVMYWERLRFWVYNYRIVTDPTLYARFEYLYQKIEKRSRSKDGSATYLVGYGSLMDAESVSSTLERRVVSDELVPVRLTGFKRAWSLGDEVRLNEDGRKVLAAFIDLEPAANSTIDAVMFPISPGELKRVARRERNYKQVTITNQVQLIHGKPVQKEATVVTFLGEEKYRLTSGKHDAVLLIEYIELVGRGSRSISEELERELLTSATEAPWQKVSGEYRFVDADQAKLV